MHKIFSELILVLVFIIALTSCGNKTSGNNETEEVQTYDKFKGNIVAGTVFSEGLALVCDGKNSYCINTNGEIVFKTAEENIDTFGGASNKGFINGLIFVDEGFYDTKGKYVSPSDVGATTFYCCGLPAGYIIADIGDSDSNYKRGVLNTEFKWVKEPNREYYQNCIDKNVDLNDDRFVYDGHIFFHHGHAGFENALEILTGKVYNKGDFPSNDLPSNTWLGTDNGTVIDFNNNIKIDATKKETDRIIFDFEVVNNKMIANFLRSDTNSKDTQYFALIDLSGNYVFEPKAVPDELNEVVNTGKYICVYSNSKNEDNFLQVYDFSGKKLLETEKIEANQFYICDDIIVMYHSYFMYNENIKADELKTEVKYYDMEFKELFS